MEPVSIIFIPDKDHLEVLREMEVVILDISGDPIKVTSPSNATGGDQSESPCHTHETTDLR